MPFVNHLTIENLRILHRVDLELAARANVFVGPNASGKTSVLEALHILGRGRSFRESQWRAVIEEGHESLRVVGKVTSQGRRVSIGIERQRDRATIKVAGEAQYGTKALLEWLPLQLVHPDSHRLIEQGPTYRRQYLDWGVFHVEQRFFPAWQRYRRALKQRNAVLRERGARDLIIPWEAELSSAATEIDGYRRDYLEKLEAYLPTVGKALLGNQRLGVRYQRGWKEGDLASVLQDTRDGDCHYGYTRAGPHRADLELFVGEYRAAQRVSRGQQKLLVLALILAQADLLRDTRGRHSLLLIDDIGAELDIRHLERLWSFLIECGSQLVVSGTDLDGRLPLEASRDALFHVEHGAVSRVL